jgi:hypothetical protein
MEKDANYFNFVTSLNPISGPHSPSLGGRQGGLGPGVLLFDILFKNRKRSAARGYHAIGPMPKHRLPIELFDMGLIHPADSA